MTRSYLFVPANRPDRCTKAVASKADAVIVDLEDAVSVDQKDAAREDLKKWLTPERTIFVRINGPETKWFQEDLDICTQPGVVGIVLPKADEVEQVEMVARRLTGSQILLPFVETARSFSNVNSIARASRIDRCLFGSLDLQIDLGMNAEEDELLYFRSLLVMASRLAGIQPPVDGISTTFTDVDRIRKDAARARRLGFSGKLCIHPAQAEVVNEVFMPTKDEVEWANRIMEAAASSGGSATSVNGVMIDRPVIVKAEKILSTSKQRN